MVTYVSSIKRLISSRSFWTQTESGVVQQMYLGERGNKLSHMALLKEWV